MSNRFCLLILLLLAGCATSSRAPSPAIDQALTLNQKAAAAFAKQNYPLALQLYQEAVRVHSTVENTEGIAINLLNVAATYRALGQHELAHRTLDAAFALRRLAAPTGLLAEAAYQHALLYFDENQTVAATDWLVKATGCCPDNACAIAGKLQNLRSRMALARGETAHAIVLADQALSLNRARNDELEIANSLRLLGEARTHTGEFAAARARFNEALALDKTLGLSRKVAADLLGIGTALRGEHKPAEAVEYFHRAFTVSDAANDTAGKELATKLIKEVK